MQSLTSILIGSSDECSFEQRLYKGLCITCALGNLGMFISHVLNNLLPDMLISLSGVICSGILYFFARYRKKYYNFSFYLYFSILIVLSLVNDLGLHRSTPFVCLVALLIMFAYSPVKWHIQISLYVISLALIILLFGDSLHNLGIQSYMSQKVSYTNLIIGVLTTVIFCYVCIYMLRKSYEDERDKNLEQKALLEKTNDQKSMFFINLSHEIKTPLTLIDNYIDKYIERKGEDEELLVIRRNIKKMSRDILDYLNVESLEKGNLSYEKRETVLLSKFLEEKIITFKPYAETKDIGITWHIEPGIHVSINLKGIDQMLNNLLENAVKYTPEQGKINIQLKKEGKNALMSIQNSGSVIQKERLPHLFEPFYQLSNEKLNAQGIGIGLYIVKKIIDSSDGRIYIDSNKNEGVTFSVALPLCIVKKNIAVPRNSLPVLNTEILKVHDSPYNIHKSNLLVVEDHKDLLYYLTVELSECYNVFVAGNGLEAANKLANMPIPDLIVSDIMMDKMDGYELLSETMANKKIAHVPFIFLTAKDTPEERIASYEMGALDFISKPFSIDELKIKIRTIIEKKNQISEVAVRAAKQQLKSNHFLIDGQTNDEVFKTNVLRYNLTEREKEIILHVQMGLRYEEIGEKLFISERTVVRHVQNIYKKTSVSSKIELMQKIFKPQLIG